MAASSATPAAAAQLPPQSRNKNMQRRISVGLPTHLRLQGKGYGVPAVRKPSFASTGDATSRNWITWPEVFSSILVALPYVFISIMKDHISVDTRSDSPLQPPALFASLTVATATLVICGLFGLVHQFTAPSEQRRLHSKSGHKQGTQSRSAFASSRKAVKMFFAVALPFYAASSLGGARVGLIMLLALFSKIVTPEEGATALMDIKGWKQLLQYRHWTVSSILVQALYDWFNYANPVGKAAYATGYLALAISIVALPPPFPSMTRAASSYENNAPSVSGSVVLSSGFESPSIPEVASLKRSTISPMVSSPGAIRITFQAGGIAAVLCVLTVITSDVTKGVFDLWTHGWFLLASSTASMCLIMAQTQSLQENKGLGILVGAVTSSLLAFLSEADTWRYMIIQSLLIGLSFLASQIDTPTVLSTIPKANQQSDSGHHHPTHFAHGENHSRLTRLLLDTFRHRPLLHSILVEKDSRRIFYFMSLNFAFMLVQLFYGIATGSLGLLSDSIHMFFDCLALIVGLCAAVMSKWPPSPRFPYGYGKIDTLAGFANGIFLMYVQRVEEKYGAHSYRLISLEIIYEAVERLVEGSEMQRLGELLTVSTLGLLVNLVGVTAFGHAHHGHSHHGHSHHDHSDHDHSGQDHSDHDHSGHDHSGHDHSGHDHSGHDHPGHGHPGHDHPGHDDCDHQHNSNSSNNHHIKVSSSPSLHDHPGHSHQSHDHAYSPHDTNEAHDNHQLARKQDAANDRHHHTLTTPSPSPYSSVPATPSKPVHSHSHASEAARHHHHGHGNENMHGIYLHVLADTLGSVAVVVSTLLIHFYGWSGFDPLASCMIAILIFASAVPLVQSTAKKLLLTIPEDVEFDLREALAGVSALRGVVGYAAPKFWLDEGNGRKVIGVIHVTAGRGVDMEDVKERAVAFLKTKEMDILVQVEREGVDRCWCKAKAG
ncbi:MAG: hypothetical protein Q9208_007915 [Pyrenodesmia sp. 3 TL-2023]